MAKYWSEGRGMVSDTEAKDRFSEHSQCLALLSGMLPPERESRVLKGLLDAPDAPRQLGLAAALHPCSHRFAARLRLGGYGCWLLRHFQHIKNDSGAPKGKNRLLMRWP